MGRVLDMMILVVMVVLLLAPIHLFLTYRLRRAQERGEDRAYLPHADPWLPAVVALTGAGLLILLRVFR